MTRKNAKNALRAARERLGLSQAAIGRKLGITSAAVGHYESGIAKPPLVRARQLARLLKIDVETIPTSSRAMRGSRKSEAGAAPAGQRLSARETEIVEALRGLSLAKRRPAIEMVLAYAASLRS